ncbi:carboxypeptidase regulatory-like domain-containing protein [Hymenobacter psoromatis]|uniref:carboxypeptidase regulatory-like domain-containing protein n=1 Tax=Hymenobacter psoromatis TaxID=1484116 RepID=UPI001CBEDF1E|nr:carboxypeptidase regulatory-like domain-containing protein [Hymenobacter psoromatis]
MLSLRSSFAAFVAGSLLLAGPAQAVRTQPAGQKTDRPATIARRGATARPGAAKAAAPAGSRVARHSAGHAAKHATPAVATVPPAAAPAVLAEAPKLVNLTGRVLDTKGRPYPGVSVFPTTNTHQVTVTDAQGNFQLQVPAQTAMSLQADYFGVGSSRVAIDGNTTQPLRIVVGR